MIDPRIEQIHIHLIGVWSTTKKHPHENEDYETPEDICEFYSITYPLGDERKEIGRFWICNRTQEAIQLFLPLDISLVNYILEEIHNRSFRRDWAAEFPEKFSQENA